MKFWCLCAALIALSGCSSSQPAKAGYSGLLKEQHKRTGVVFTVDTAHLNASPWDLHYQQVSELQKNNYLPLFEEEFIKLPTEVLHLSALRTVAFVRQLAIGGQQRAAIPDYHHEVLYYDISQQAGTYLRHVIHHEFYHMLEEQLYGSAYYQDPLWHALNTPDFRYGKGGAADRNSQVAVFSHPAPGFVNQYAMSGIEEDKAELWAIIWAQHSWQQNQAFIEKDPILQAKLALLMQQLQCKAPALKNAWPIRARRYIPVHSDCSTINSGAD